MNSFFQGLLSALTGSPQPSGPLAGIRYFSGSWPQVLAQAQSLNKPIFLDFYTIGFYPRQQAALDASFATTFNTHFINYLVDAQHGEGPQIAQRYRMLTAPVPTALFILGDGILLHRAAGYSGLKDLLAQAHQALQAATQPNRLPILEQDYVAGRRNAPFLEAYLLERSRANMPNQEALLSYLALMPQTNWATDETIPLILGHLTTYQPGPVGALLAKLRQGSPSPDSSSLVGPTPIGERIRALIRMQFHQALSEQDEGQLAGLIADNEQLLRAERADTLTAEDLDQMAKGHRRRYYTETRYRPLPSAGRSGRLAVDDSQPGVHPGEGPAGPGAL